MQQYSSPFQLHRSLRAALLAVSLCLAAHSQSTSLPEAPVPQQQQTKDADQQKESPSSDEVLRREEKQRAFGVMPMFTLVNGGANIPPLRPKQKFHLMFKSSTDPFVFALVGVVAGVGQARDTNSGTKVVTNPDGTQSTVRWGFGQGASGYFKR